MLVHNDTPQFFGRKNKMAAKKQNGHQKKLNITQSIFKLKAPDFA